MQWVQSDVGRAIQLEALVPSTFTLSAGSRTSTVDFSASPTVTGCSVASMTLFDTALGTAIAPLVTDLDATVTGPAA